MTGGHRRYREDEHQPRGDADDREVETTSRPGGPRRRLPSPWRAPDERHRCRDGSRRAEHGGDEVLGADRLHLGERAEQADGARQCPDRDASAVEQDPRPHDELPGPGERGAAAHRSARRRRCANIHARSASPLWVPAAAACTSPAPTEAMAARRSGVEVVDRSGVSMRAGYFASMMAACAVDEGTTKCRRGVPGPEPRHAKPVRCRQRRSSSVASR